MQVFAFIIYLQVYLAPSVMAFLFRQSHQDRNLGFRHFEGDLFVFGSYFRRICVYISSVTTEAASVVTEENPRKLRLTPKEYRRRYDPDKEKTQTRLPWFESKSKYQQHNQRF